MTILDTSAAVRPLRPQTYLPALDGLRAVAIWLVMGRHLIGAVFPGEFGVTLFFFISGFIITRNCLERPFTPGSVLPFYAKRFFRLAPAVYVYLLVAAIAVHSIGGAIPMADMRATVLYYANYHHFSLDTAPGNHRPPLEMTWSLAVEEHFYLAFPLALVLSRTPKRLGRLLLVAIAATCAWRLWRWHVWHNEWSIYTHTDTRLDSIAYGCLLATGFAMAPANARIGTWLTRAARLPVVALAFAVVVTTVVADTPPLRAMAAYPLQGIALMPIFCLLFWSASPWAQNINRFLASPFVNWTGRLSYFTLSLSCSSMGAHLSIRTHRLERGNDRHCVGLCSRMGLPPVCGKPRSAPRPKARRGAAATLRNV